jgi:hypothetical protein
VGVSSPRRIVSAHTPRLEKTLFQLGLNEDNIQVDGSNEIERRRLLAVKLIPSLDGWHYQIKPQNWVKGNVAFLL